MYIDLQMFISSENEDIYEQKMQCIKKHIKIIVTLYAFSIQAKHKSCTTINLKICGWSKGLSNSPLLIIPICVIPYSDTSKIINEILNIFDAIFDKMEKDGIIISWNLDSFDSYFHFIPHFSYCADLKCMKKLMNIVGYNGIFYLESIVCTTITVGNIYHEFLRKGSDFERITLPFVFPWEKCYNTYTKYI